MVELVLYDLFSQGTIAVIFVCNTQSMQTRFWLFFLSCLIFIFSNTFVKAQVFFPSADLFYSELDGIWEIEELLDDYAVESIPWENSVDILLNFSWSGSVHHESLTDSFLFNNEGEFLTLNKLEAKFSTTETSTVVLKFSIRCRTDETESSFDQPFFIAFLDHELIEKEIDLELCSSGFDSVVAVTENDWGEWQEKHFLFPDISTGEHSFYFFAGEMGDKQQLTQVEISKIEMFFEVPVDSKIDTNIVSTTTSTSPTIDITPSLSPSQSSPALVSKKSSTNKKPSYDYNKPTKYHNWNTPLQGQGSVLGETESVEQDNKEKSFQLPEYFPLLMGVGVFIFSFVIIFMFLKNRAQN